MAGTFSEFIAWSDREEILLALPDALFTLTGWVSAGGGFTNTYKVAVSNQTSPPAGQASLYRNAVGVREVATELTAQTSIANVDANAGSWYWDEAAGQLYVRTTGTAVNPNTKTVIAVRLRFTLATTSIVLNRVDGSPDTGAFFEGALTASGPIATQEATDLFSGQALAWSGECVIANASGAWHHLVHAESGYTWKNQRVLFRFGGRYRGQTLDLSQFTRVATMLIEDIVADEQVCRIALKPVTRLADINVPVTPYFEASYPNLGDGVRGTFKAILYGRAWTAPALTDVSGFGTWTIADAAYQNLYRVHEVQAVAKSSGARVVLTEGQDYTVNLTTCTVTVITDRYPSTEWTLFADATGKTNKHASAGGGVGMRGYLSTASEIAQDLLHSFAGVLASGIDSAAFDEAHLDALEELSVYLPSPRALASVFSSSESNQASIERSVRAIIGQSRDGLWTMRVWDPTYDAATLPTLRKEDLAAFTPSPRLERLTTGTRIWYARDGRFGTWVYADAVDQVQRDLTGVQDIVELYTFLRNAGDAEVLAARYQFVERYSTIDVDFVERGTLLALAEVGDRILVTHDPAPDATGKYTNRAFALTRVERGYAPRMTVQGQLQDVHRVTNRCGRWKDAAEPTYASASAAQRLLAGYWGAASSPSSSLGWQ